MPYGKQNTGGTGGTGSTWYDGAGPPAAGLGVNTDQYLNVTNGDVYQKAAGVWSITGNIKGVAGTNGTNGAPGFPITVNAIVAAASGVNSKNNICSGGPYSVASPAPVAGSLIAYTIAPTFTGLMTLTPNGTQKINGVNANFAMWAKECVLFYDNGTDLTIVGGSCRPLKSTIVLSGGQPGNPGGFITVVLFDAVLFDNSGLMADVANNRIIIPRTAEVNISANVEFAATASGNALIEAYILIGAAGTTSSGLINSGGSVSFYYSSVPVPLFTISQNANDKIRLAGFGNSNNYSYDAGDRTYLSVVESPIW